MIVQTLAQVREPHLLVITNEPPWPAIHGARVDQWNRYQALHQEGWVQMLLHWREAGDATESVAPVFAQTLAIETDRTVPAQLRRAARMISQPSLAAVRAVREDQFGEIREVVRKFGPDIIVCEFVYCLGLARRLADSLKVPLVIRSHNIEHRYMTTQLRLANSWRQRLQIMAARLNLRRYETAALRSADAVLDISKSDAQFWRTQGVENIHWVPTFFPSSVPPVAQQSSPWHERKFDIGYLGNLWAPNNVAAIKWFLDEILPGMLQDKPDLSVVIAGAKPRPELVSWVESKPNLTLVANPPDAHELRAQVRVLINPIREGSGLNTKSVEMLYCDSPIVVTPFAIEGMDDSTAGAFVVAKDVAEFSRLAVAALAEPYMPDESRQAARQLFSHGGSQAMSKILKGVVARHRELGA